MSKKIFFIVLIILTATILKARPYESLPDPTQLNADIEKFGANQVLDRIWNSDRAFGELFDRISSGNAIWIAIAVKLRAVSDAGVTESLYMAMSRALAKNPESVLSVLTSNYKLGSFEAERVCGGDMLYINYAESEIDKWRREAISAVSGVNIEGLEEIKALCIKYISR
jgi:hypothetical protein